MYKRPDPTPYIPPDQATKDYIFYWYDQLNRDWQLKDEPYREVGNQTLSKLWRYSNDEYDVIVPVREKTQWKRTTKSGIPRDKANGFIAKITRETIFPEINAQNKHQEDDAEVSRAVGELNEWWQSMDKWERKYADSVHKSVVEGTVHVQIDVINGKEVKTIAPNEEIYLPNFYQPDIQKQAHVIRVQKMHYDEAKMIFGENDNWEHVGAGASGKWALQDDDFKFNRGLLVEDEVQVVYVWGHEGYDKKGKPKPKHHGILINGIPMKDTNNTLILKHNLFPLAKGVFEKTSDPLFYWGNSLLNKIRHDSRYLNAFRSIVLNKAILNLLPPLFNKGQEHTDQDVIVPAKITTTQNEKGDMYKIEGVAEPLTNADFAVLEGIERDIDNSTTPPTSLGQDAGGSNTLGEVQLKDARAGELMEIFGKMMSFFVEDVGEQSVSNMLQFVLMSDVERTVVDGKILTSKKVEIPGRTLDQGYTGTLSLNFTPEGQQPDPLDLLQQQEDAFQKTGQRKEIMHIDPEYLNNSTFYFRIVGNPAAKPSKVMDRLIAMEKYNTVYFNNPNINQMEATREVVKQNGDDEQRLLAEQQPQQPQQQGQGPKAPTIKQPTDRVKQSQGARMAI